jgi:CopA family copper-resistance protein
MQCLKNNFSNVYRIRKYVLWAFVLIIFSISNALAANRTVDLTVNSKTVNFTGKTRTAIAINDQIPAPTLHFKEGDHITINVHNQLDKETSIHWHGMILPWQMDGVEGITQKPIPPGGVFHYEFTLRQSGTYWYHAHADVQEQEGVYGAFIIDPRHTPSYQYNKDQVIVLSDWSDTPAERIFANLKKEGDYYSPRFPLQPSLMKFIRDYRKANPKEKRALIDDYKMMQEMRMSIYDISDVAYDAYLLNGKTSAHPWTSLVKLGDVVRLRFISAAGSTIYRVKIPDTTMRVVQVQGNDVKPYDVHDFEIAPGETYDVLVKIEKKDPYIIYAESLDTRGAAIGALITDNNQAPVQCISHFGCYVVPVSRSNAGMTRSIQKPHTTQNERYAVLDDKQIKPFPEPLPVSRDMMSNMMPEMDHAAMNMGDGMHAAHDMNMEMPTESTLIGDTISPPGSFNAITTGTKYQNLKAAVQTNDPKKPVDGIIRMELFGYMDRFIWFINGVPEYKAKPISIQEGKRYRIIFTNTSMMRHPMHIHGHWFILRNGHGVYDPLLHTIEMAPGATAVADFDADASGQWFFHCHHIYHMQSGMARVFQYQTIIGVSKGEIKPQHEISHEPYANRPIVRVDEESPIDPSLIHHPMAHAPGRFRATFLDVGYDPFNNIQKVTFNTLMGSDYHKLQLYIEDAEMNEGKIDNADIDVFYWHVLNQFWSIKGGVNYYYRPAEKPYWQPGIGIEGLMPYFIAVNLRSYYHNGAGKLDLDLSRDTQITNNFFIRTGVRGIAATKTVDADEVGSGLNQIRYIVRPYYRLKPGLSAFFEYEHESAYGTYAHLLRHDGESTSRNSYTVGLSFLF